VALLRQPRLRIRGALVCGVRALLAVDVHRGVPRVVVGTLGRLSVSWFEAFQAGCGFDERSIYREVLIREQTPGVGSTHHPVKHLLSDFVFKQPLAILSKHGGIEARFEQFHVQEPAEQQVVIEFFTERPLAAHRIQRDQHRRLEQALGWNGGTSDLGVHLVQQRRKLSGGFVGQPFDRSQRVLRRHSLFQIDARQHRHLGPALPSHFRPPTACG
jgi:hypothetical protein